jgi:hypothetical protein
MSDELYAWIRFGETPNTNTHTLQTIYAHDENKSFFDIGGLVMSETNYDYITNLIIQRADPLRNGNSVGQYESVIDKVKYYLSGWSSLGKFENESIVFEGKTYLVKTMSPTALVDHFNKEFVKVYGDVILPIPDITKVTSVVNPNGLLAQQERILTFNSKPVPFYERALYRRLGDKHLEQRLDETESPFYKMDNNPNISSSEKKKRDANTKHGSSYLDRENISYRMIPKY